MTIAATGFAAATSVQTFDYIVTADCIETYVFASGLSLVEGTLLAQPNQSGIGTTGTTTSINSVTCTGITLWNSDNGILYGKISATTAVVTVSLYSTTAYTTAVMVATGSSQSASATTDITLTAINSSGISAHFDLLAIGSNAYTALFTIVDNQIRNVYKWDVSTWSTTGTQLVRTLIGVVKRYNNTTGQCEVVKRGTVKIDNCVVTGSIQTYRTKIAQKLAEIGITAV